ncbi:MAG: phenylalanine--tRNA ligase subunit beta [Chloroflexi bacterium]|nr:phenylalanine--tRNA ligase subunit beta [Chloroflexota bacterium]
MRAPLSWLKEYVDIDLPVDVLAEKLTLAGLEVANIEYIGVLPPESERRRMQMKPGDVVTGDGHIAWERDKIFVGQILKTEKHPNADRLLLVTVDYGADEPLTVITGAPNLKPGDSGQKVAFATVGAVLVDAYADTFKTKKLKAGKIRGIRSEGMACSERELGISDEHEGVIILPDDAPVGTPLADYLGDVVFDIDVTPNMIRIASIIGIAREIAAITGAPLHVEMPTWQTQPPPAGDYCEVEIIDDDLCYRFTASIIRNVEVRPSPFWMQHRLKLVGQRPLNNLVDVTNYVMFEWGKPLHAFDYDKLLARARSIGKDKVKIIVRRAKPGEKFVTLDGVERELDPDILMICDEVGPVGIGGVMGGLETEVSESTRNVLLESATFNFINIRRTSRKLKLPSEAAYRFSRGVPSELDPIGNIRGAQLMAELGGGTIADGIVEDYPRPQPVVEVPLSAQDVRRWLGIDLSQKEIIDILERLEFGIREEGETIWATVPWYRQDVNITADLLEEIARIYGYENIPETLLADELPPQRHNWPIEMEEYIRDVLIGCGLQEVINYSLTSVENHAKLYPDHPDQAPSADQFITLANPLSPERMVMRRSMVVSALENLARNLRYTERLTTFELGLVYLPEEGDGELPAEVRHLCLAMTGPRNPGNWLGGDEEPLDFFDMKGVLEVLFERLHADAAISYEPGQAPYCGPRCARILLDGREIGVFGELHPRVRRAFDLPDRPVLIADLVTDPLIPYFQRPPLLRKVSEYPPVKEDMALIVDESIPAARVEALIRQTAGDALTDLRLFDVYRGEPIPAGKKSLAFSLTFQSLTKTLTDKDTARLRRKIAGRLSREIGAVLREG